MDLYQAEWCPHSHNVRQRLTELGLDFTARQVPADPDDRAAMMQATGTNEIPVLITGSGGILKGEDEIMPWLDRFQERNDAEEHRRKAREEVPEFASHV